MTTRLTSARGVTEISDRALGRIARRAAGEADGVRTRDAGSSDDGISLKISVAYPSPAREAARRARAAVRERVEALTGVPAGRVDIDVVAMTRGTS
ncbi:hypothetical protein J4573_04865 [Actinomadura barringtoniae]|uniref:Asp23/Gls24 family envelope stress response protein n=1 Tax=Actinomadura barringtoniae TaxID=1427535 RepID=A0A939T3B7_9ACTN|nr:hypothetical protein [Actinomadura barringtoniae]MBO2446409.1 hypothetical protein [Actinomadura barringtoniae]